VYASYSVGQVTTHKGIHLPAFTMDRANHHGDSPILTRAAPTDQPTTGRADLGDASVVPASVLEHEGLQEAELRDGEVRGVHGLPALAPADAHADLSAKGGGGGK
jgi:hypothetical protein